MVLSDDLDLRSAALQSSHASATSTQRSNGSSASFVQHRHSEQRLAQERVSEALLTWTQGKVNPRPSRVPSLGLSVLAPVASEVVEDLRITVQVLRLRVGQEEHVGAHPRPADQVVHVRRLLLVEVAVRHVLEDVVDVADERVAVVQPKDRLAVQVIDGHEFLTRPVAVKDGHRVLRRRPLRADPSLPTG